MPPFSLETSMILDALRPIKTNTTSTITIALIAFALCAIPALVTDAEAQVRTAYDLESIESRVQAEVTRAVDLYKAQGEAAFNTITPERVSNVNKIIPFVVKANNLEIVAHGAVPNFVGQVAQGLTRADKPYRDILTDLRDGEVWIEHIGINPANGQNQAKRTLLQLHEGYIFAAGHYLADSEIQQFVEDTVRLYESHGRGAFDRITPDAPITTDALYPFVINAATWTRVADGVVPSRVGQPETILDTSARSVTNVLADLRANGGTWVTYTFHNPATDIEQLKRTWLYLHDGYVFGSGYYPHDSTAQSLVDAAIILYTARGVGAFNAITPDEPDPFSTRSTFVLDADTLRIVAHGRSPGLVGTTDTHLASADISLERINERLSTEKGIWIWHMARNPATQTDQLTHTYLSLRDGYIFGAGYSLPDIRLQSVVDDAIFTYRNSPQTGFETISSGALNRIDVFPVVRNATHIVAHGAVPGLIGTSPQVEGLRNFEEAREALIRSGGSLWSQFSFVNPLTGTEQIQRTFWMFYDSYLFGATYIVSDADAQSVTDYARFIYESNRENDAWIDIITPDEPIRTDALYPFVIDAATWTRLADGVVPARVGQPETILDTSARSVEDVLADLRANGRTWVTYTFHNPDTGVEQLKRSYLQLHDGIVFGSGYYLLDSHVQGVTQSRMLEYSNDGRNAAIASINAIPDAPFTTYAFVVDPRTGETVAQNVDPGAIGSVTDWSAITGVLSAQEIIDATGQGTGMWVSYPHTNPVTGETETKRAWLAMHDGLIFGAGYYTSDIPESDVRFAVSNAIRIYETNQANDAWIDIITPDAPITTDALYPFVIDAATWTRLADGVVPARVGQPETILDTSARTPGDVLAELREKGSLWVTYIFHNPATGVEQLKRSYLQLHDGLVFGSGYYVLESNVQSASHSRILEYERDGRDAALASINTIPESPVSTYVFAIHSSTGSTVAQNADPRLIGTSDWDAIVSVHRAEDIRDATNKGTGAWVSYPHTNPVTGQEETKRSWLVMFDDLIFGAGYYTSDIPALDVRFAVSNAIRIYETNQANDAWIDIITPDAPITTDALYPFVIDAATWTRLADGVVPARVGQPETILDTSARTPGDVLAELREKGSLWVTYIFHNPATGVEQLKRSYLQLHDGLVFGSGYYVLESNVQSASHSRILEYERDGRDAALASINTIPDAPFTTYAFVVDPEAGNTVAQNVDPDSIGYVTDWSAITTAHSSQGIVDVISRGTGTWVSYPHTNPVTGEAETKRAWLVMFDGLIFGAGYYTSDILATPPSGPGFNGAFKNVCR